LTILIPCLNEAAEIETLLQRLREMQNAGVRVLFIDGGSSDDTVARIRTAGFDCMQSEAGRAVQMNAGATLCTTEVLWFIHADTVVTADHIADIRHAMVDSVVVGGRFDVRLSGRHPLFRMIEFFINVRSRITKISTGDQAMFVRRDVFERLGGFPDQPLMEDVEFSRYLKRVGKVVCLSRPVITSSRRWEQHGISRTMWLMWKLRLYYWLGIPVEKLAAKYDHVR